MARWLDTVDADAPDCNRKFDTQQFSAICWTHQAIFHTKKAHSNTNSSDKLQKIFK